MKFFILSEIEHVEEVSFVQEILCHNVHMGRSVVLHCWNTELTALIQILTLEDLDYAWQEHAPSVLTVHWMLPCIDCISESFFHEFEHASSSCSSVETSSHRCCTGKVWCQDEVSCVCWGVRLCWMICHIYCIHESLASLATSCFVLLHLQHHHSQYLLVVKSPLLHHSSVVKLDFVLLMLDDW